MAPQITKLRRRAAAICSRRRLRALKRPELAKAIRRLGAGDVLVASPDRFRPRLQDGARRHCLEAQGFRLPFRPLARLAQNEERRCTGRKAGRRGRLGKRAVTELKRKHLVKLDRHIAECKEYIAKQRDRIKRAIEQGRSTEVAEPKQEPLNQKLLAF